MFYHKNLIRLLIDRYHILKEIFKSLVKTFQNDDVKSILSTNSIKQSVCIKKNIVNEMKISVLYYRNEIIKNYSLEFQPVVLKTKIYVYAHSYFRRNAHTYMFHMRNRLLMKNINFIVGKYTF